MGLSLISLDKHIFLGAQVLLALAKWALLSLIAKNYSAQVAGDYGLITAILPPIFLLFAFQLRNHLLGHDLQLQKDFAPYLYIRLFSIAPMAIITAASLFFFTVDPYFLAVVFSFKLTETLFELPFTLEQKADHLLSASLKMIARTFFVYASIPLAVALGLDLMTAFLIATLIGFLAFIIYFFDAQRAFQFKLYKASFTPLLKTVLPLGVAAALASFNASMPRFFLSKILDKESVAAFTIVFTFFAVWQLIFNSYLNSVLHKFQKLAFLHKVGLPLCLFCVFIIVFELYADSIYTLFFGSAYSYLADFNLYLYLTTLMSFAFSYVFYSLISRQDFANQLRFNFLTIIVHILISLPLIQHLKLKGAFIAWILSQLFQNILYTQKYWRGLARR